MIEFYRKSSILYRWPPELRAAGTTATISVINSTCAIRFGKKQIANDTNKKSRKINKIIRSFALFAIGTLSSGQLHRLRKLLAS